jgi:hypothetical protein
MRKSIYFIFEMLKARKNKLSELIANQWKMIDKVNGVVVYLKY